MIKPIKPISPTEVEDKPIPDEVIAAFNALILKNYIGKEARVEQEEALKLAVKNFKASGKKITEDKIFDNKWMDVEDLFRKEGWRVTYDKPAYNETYEAYFIFKK
jgi:hypothetical protein